VSFESATPHITSFNSSFRALRKNFPVFIPCPKCPKPIGGFSVLCRPHLQDTSPQGRLRIYCNIRARQITPDKLHDTSNRNL
jgi:hypothetical protein